MSEELFHQDEPLSEVLQQVSSQLRLSLGNIHNALTRLAPRTCGTSGRAWTGTRRRCARAITASSA